jgi:large subunit ribosomal protein L10
MNKSEKALAIEQLERQFADSKAVWLTEYRGLTVSAIKELRKDLGDEGNYAVVKNTLTSIAAQNSNQKSELISALKGPSALAFITGDPVAGAKTLKKFAENNPALIVKGGIFEGDYVNYETFSVLADLESREVLLSKAVGAMKGTLSKAAALFIAVPTKFVGAANSLKERKQ